MFSLSLKIHIFLGYIDGPSVLKSGSKDCSEEQGELEWAMKKCDSDSNCKWIHDLKCDNKTWRFCPNVEIEKYINRGDRPQSCSKIKNKNQGNFHKNILRLFHSKIIKNKPL